MSIRKQSFRSQAQPARKPPAGLKLAGGLFCGTGGPTQGSAPTFYSCLELGTTIRLVTHTI
jgi:hypothetical protein